MSEVRRLRQLESENARLKKIVADQLLARSALKELLATGKAPGQAQSCGLADGRVGFERAARQRGGRPVAVGVIGRCRKGMRRLSIG